MSTCESCDWSLKYITYFWQDIMAMGLPRLILFYHFVSLQFRKCKKDDLNMCGLMKLLWNTECLSWLDLVFLQLLYKARIAWEWEMDWELVIALDVPAPNPPPTGVSMWHFGYATFFNLILRDVVLLLKDFLWSSLVNFVLYLWSIL